jgi:hypothetical protein
LCDGHGIGGDGEYCGNNDAQLGRINVLYHEGGKYGLHGKYPKAGLLQLYTLPELNTHVLACSARL